MMLLVATVYYVWMSGVQMASCDHCHKEVHQQVGVIVHQQKVELDRDWPAEMGTQEGNREGWSGFDLATLRATNVAGGVQQDNVGFVA